MSSSRTRSRLRKARQQQNRAFLSAEQKNENPRAAKQFIAFGRLYDGRYYKVTFEDFCERFPENPLPSLRRSIPKQFINAAREFAAAISRRRAANKLRKKQRSRTRALTGERLA